MLLRLLSTFATEPDRPDDHRYLGHRPAAPLWPDVGLAPATPARSQDAGQTKIWWNSAL